MYNIYFCFIDYAKAFDCVDHNKLWKILKEMGIPDTWLASREICMQVKKQQLELDMEQQTGSKWGKEYIKAVILSSCLFNLYAEYIMRNTGLEEAQAGIKIPGRNINNLRYADDTALMISFWNENEWKLTFSSPVATAGFSKFAGILSAALSQHHLSGFERAPLEFHNLH